eukprot:scaffold36901_cov24-Tisochrysis_lutea.AAC.3
MESAFGPPAGGGQERHKSEGVTCTQEMGVAGVGWGQDRQQGGYVDTLNGWGQERQDARGSYGHRKRDC